MVGDPPLLRGSVSDRVVNLIELLHDLDRCGPAALDGVSADLADDALTVKLADRLHNARTWRFIPPARARRKAQETIALYAPAAESLGLIEVGVELNRLAEAELASSRTWSTPPRTDVTEPERTPSPIVGRAVSRLPPGERERYGQEWAADLATLHTRRERRLFTLGILWSARRLR